jgi:hypothetical protein
MFSTSCSPLVPLHYKPRVRNDLYRYCLVLLTHIHKYPQAELIQFDIEHIEYSRLNQKDTNCVKYPDEQGWS